MAIIREYLRGFSSALTFGPDANLAQVTNENCLATDIVSILDERQGEWLLSNQHGTTIPADLFEQNDDTLKAILQSKLVSEVSAQEDRVTFGALALVRGSDKPEMVPWDLRDQADHIVFILVPFRVKATNEEKMATLTLQREGQPV